MESRDILLFVHILAAIAWLGGGLFAAVLGARVLASRNGAEMAGYVRNLAWFGGRYFPPLSLVVLAAGIALVLESPVYGFSDPWVSAGFVGIIGSIVIGVGFLGPRSERVAKLAEEHGPEHPEVRTVTASLLMLARVDLAILVAVVAVMVFKPGA